MENEQLGLLKGSILLNMCTTDISCELDPTCQNFYLLLYMAFRRPTLSSMSVEMVG